MEQTKSTRIIIQRRNGIRQYLLLVLLSILLGTVAFLEHPFLGILLLVLLLLLIFREYAYNETYLSEIVIYDSYLQLVYRCKNVVVSKRIIEKQDIKNFHVRLYVSDFGRIDGDTTLEIDIQNSKPIIYKFSTSNNRTSLMEGPIVPPWKATLDLVKNHEVIPHFSYQVDGSDYIKEKVRQYYKYGKNFGIIEDLKVQYRTRRGWGKFFTILYIFGFLFLFIVWIIVVFVMLYLMSR